MWADPTPGVNRFSSTPDGIPDIGTVQYLTTTDARSNQYTIRVDHELRPGKDRLYGYFYRLNARTITPGIRPDFLRPSPTWGLFGNLVYTRTISPTALNEVRMAATRFIGHYCAPKDPKDPIGGGLSCPDMLNKQVPGINITGLGTVRDVNVFPGGFFPTEYQLKDTFSMMHGSHALKMGGEVRRAINILWHTASFVPVYTFASILDFVDDEPQQMTRTVDPRTGLPTTTRADMLIWEGAGFIQDDWKVRRNLTINIGLRYDYFGPYSDTHDRFRNFVPGTGSYAERLATGKVDVTPRGWSTDTLNFAPRFGFAWDIGATGRNVIRGGYGLSYDRMATVQTATYRTNPPLAATATLGQNFGTDFTYSLGDPTKPFYGYPIDASLKLGLDPRNGISGVRVAIAAIDQGFNNPYAHNWFLGVQRQLPGQLVAEVSWIGSAGHHMVNISNVNRYNGDMLDNRFDGFNPSFSSINMARTTSNSIYHGGTFAVRRSFSKGVTFQGSYTFGKVLTDAEAEQGTTSYYDANNRNLDRSAASFDVRQRVAFSGVWELPFLRDCSSAGLPGPGRLATLRLWGAGIRPADDGIHQRVVSQWRLQRRWHECRPPQRAGGFDQPFRIQQTAVPQRRIQRGGLSEAGARHRRHAGEEHIPRSGIRPRGSFAGKECEVHRARRRRAAPGVVQRFQSRESELAGHRPDEQQFREGDERGRGTAVHGEFTVAVLGLRPPEAEKTNFTPVDSIARFV